MRSLALLLLPAFAAADDTFPMRLQDFEEARRFTLEPGGQARVHPAVEALVATGDVRAIAPLANYLLETITSERRVFDGVRKTQQAGAVAHEKVEALTLKLKQLELKEKAGDRTVGPLIEQCTSERADNQRIFDEHRKAVEQMDRVIGFLRGLRERLADGCVKLLTGRTGQEAKEGIAAVRRALDVADREQAIFLVRILSASELPEAEDQLLEILSAPKADESVRLRAEYALAGQLTRRGAEALLRIWESGSELAVARAQHVLSLAAKRRLATIEEAREWAATLP